MNSLQYIQAKLSVTNLHENLASSSRNMQGGASEGQQRSIHRRTVIAKGRTEKKDAECKREFTRRLNKRS